MLVLPPFFHLKITCQVARTLRCTSLIEHYFEMQTSVTVHSRPYTLPGHERQIILKELAEMLKIGVIEESHSAWSSPIVLVVKKDVFIWFCDLL